MYGYKNVLITKFGLKNTGFKEGDNWKYDINNSLKILLNYTKFSVENQTNLDDLTWVFIVGEYVTSDIKNLIQNSISNKIKINFITKLCNEEVDIDSEIMKITNTPEFISMRLDSDDYMHPSLLDIVSKRLIQNYNGKNISICGPTNGYSCQQHNYYSFCKSKIAIGLGMLNNLGMTVNYHHGKLKILATEKFPNIEIIEDYLLDISQNLFIYNRQNNSTSLWWRGNPVLPKTIPLSKEDSYKLEMDFKLNNDIAKWSNGGD